MKHALPIAAYAILASPAIADPAQILDVMASRTDAGWRFVVTVEHGDTGWDDYANGWEIRAEDGTVFGTRTLFHPHVDEQPFTRSLGNVEIPEGTETVEIFVSESLGGYGEAAYVKTLPSRIGE